MAYAYKELLNTDHTISSIALDNGFASSRAFSREFVKRYGILPGRVERQNHKNVKKSAFYTHPPVYKRHFSTNFLIFPLYCTVCCAASTFVTSFNDSFS